MRRSVGRRIVIIVAILVSVVVVVGASHPADANEAVMVTVSADVEALVAWSLVTVAMVGNGIRSGSRRSNRGFPKVDGSIIANYWVHFTRSDGGSGRYSGACPAFEDPVNWGCAVQAGSLGRSDYSMTRVAVA
jgi:hypothetical protein